VSTEPPDPFGNAVGRWYYVLARGLCERGHHVRWLSAYDNEEFATRARTFLAGLQGLDLSLYRYPIRNWFQRKRRTLRQPYSYFISEGLRAALAQELGRGYDILHLEPTWAGWLGLGAPRAVLSVLSLACVDFSGAFGLGPRLATSAALMKLTERRIVSGFRTIRALSARDCEVLKRLNPNARVALIPFALDDSLYEFSTEEPKAPTIGLIGNMDWFPTRSATIRLLETIWPRVKGAVDGLRVLVGGWGARRALNKYLSDPDIAILENLPSAESFFRRLSLLVFPLRRGSGTKVKVLEAMAYGVPVVTTNEGIEGIEAVDGVHAAVADDDDGLSLQIRELMTNRERRQAIRLAARRLIEENHSPSAILPKIESLYREIIQSTSGDVGEPPGGLSTA